MNLFYQQHKASKTLLLLSIVCLLASFSSPWPKHFGVIEFLIAIILVGALNKGFLLMLSSMNLRFIFFIELFILGIIGFKHNEFSDILRDLIPYLYLGMPIALYSLLMTFKEEPNVLSNDSEVWNLRFLIALSIIGFVYSLRSIYPFFLELNFDFQAVFQSHLTPHTDYMFLDPSLIFGASFFLIFGLGCISKKELSKGVLLCLVSLIIIMAPLFATMRAPAAAYALAFFMAISFSFKKRTMLAFGMLFVFVVIFSGTANQLIDKHSTLGSNGKIEEFFHVIEYMRTMPFINVLLGTGFGGVYHSTLLGVEVRFTHNILSYSLLKGGFLLFLITLALYFWVTVTSVNEIAKSYNNKNLLSFSAVVSFLLTFQIASLLQPSFKTLGYGLILVVYTLFVSLKKNTTGKSK